MFFSLSKEESNTGTALINKSFIDKTFLLNTIKTLTALFSYKIKMNFCYSLIYVLTISPI